MSVETESINIDTDSHTAFSVDLRSPFSGEQNPGEDDSIDNGKANTKFESGYSSLEDVVNAFEVKGDAKIVTESSGQSFLKRGEKQEWVYTDPEGRELSLTDTVWGEGKDEHEQILKSLYEKGFAVSQKLSEDKQNLQVGYYFADNKGGINFRTVEIKIHGKSDFDAELLDGADDDDYLPLAAEKAAPPIPLSNNFSNARAASSVVKERTQESFGDFLESLFKPKPEQSTIEHKADNIFQELFNIKQGTTVEATGHSTEQEAAVLSLFGISQERSQDIVKGEPISLENDQPVKNVSIKEPIKLKAEKSKVDVKAKVGQSKKTEAKPSSGIQLISKAAKLAKKPAPQPPKKAAYEMGAISLQTKQPAAVENFPQQALDRAIYIEEPEDGKVQIKFDAKTQPLQINALLTKLTAVSFVSKKSLAEMTKLSAELPRRQTGPETAFGGASLAGHGPALHRVRLSAETAQPEAISLVEKVAEPAEERREVEQPMPEGGDVSLKQSSVIASAAEAILTIDRKIASSDALLAMTPMRGAVERGADDKSVEDDDMTIPERVPSPIDEPVKAPVRHQKKVEAVKAVPAEKVQTGESAKTESQLSSVIARSPLQRIDRVGDDLSDVALAKSEAIFTIHQDKIASDALAMTPIYRVVEQDRSDIIAEVVTGEESSVETPIEIDEPEAKAIPVSIEQPIRPQQAERFEEFDLFEEPEPTIISAPKQTVKAPLLAKPLTFVEAPMMVEDFEQSTITKNEAPEKQISKIIELAQKIKRAEVAPNKTQGNIVESKAPTVIENVVKQEIFTQVREKVTGDYHEINTVVRVATILQTLRYHEMQAANGRKTEAQVIELKPRRKALENNTIITAKGRKIAAGLRQSVRALRNDAAIITAQDITQPLVPPITLYAAS